MVADITKQISRDYDILIEDGENAGVALRCVRAPSLCQLYPRGSDDTPHSA